MSIENVTLAALDRDPFNERNIKMCQMYVSRFSDMMRRNCWLLLWGNVGTGKSCAAAGIANGATQNGFSAEMLTFEDLLNHSRKGDEELNAIDADLVIIDDLALLPAPGSALGHGHTFLQSRHREGKPMIFTSRLSPSDMRSAPDELGGKVFDFILTVCYPMQFTGKPRNVLRVNCPADCPAEIPQTFQT